MCSAIHAFHIYITIAERYLLNTTGGDYNRGTGVWLGANDEAVEDSFVWLPSGKPVVFGDWDSGQPNDKEGGQDCVAYYNGMIFDVK